MIRKVVCLDTGEALWFQAHTAYQAMQKLLYYLNLKHKDDSAVVNMTGSCKHLFTIHNGKYWTIANYD